MAGKTTEWPSLESVPVPQRGELAEWFKAPVLKTGVRESVPQVRILHSPRWGKGFRATKA